MTRIGIPVGAFVAVATWVAVVCIGLGWSLGAKHHGADWEDTWEPAILSVVFVGPVLAIVAGLAVAFITG